MAYSMLLSLQPNGLRVLALIPGLLEEITRGHVVQSVSYSMLPDDKGELARADISLLRGLTGGFGVEGVRRKHLLDVLSASVHARGIPIVYGHQLVNIEQHTNSVTTTFANGTTAEGSFLIGCDGLHSNTRNWLFGKEQAMYTGLTQVRTVLTNPRDSLLLMRGRILCRRVASLRCRVSSKSTACTLS